MGPGILLITADFNFHVDCHSDNDAKNFADVLQTFGLQQHVQVPSHLTGHTLDLNITRSNNDITVSSPKASVALSDHFLIECNLNIPRPSSTIKETVYRKLKTLDLHAFKSQCRNISRISNQFRKIEFWFIPTKQPFGMVISENDIKKSPSALNLDNFRKVRKFTKKYNFYS